MQTIVGIFFKMELICFKFKYPKFSKTLYLDKDGVLNKVVMRNQEMSSPQKFSEIELMNDLNYLSNEVKKKTIT